MKPIKASKYNTCLQVRPFHSPTIRIYRSDFKSCWHETRKICELTHKWNKFHILDRHPPTLPRQGPTHIPWPSSAILQQNSYCSRCHKYFIARITTVHIQFWFQFRSNTCIFYVDFQIHLPGVGELWGWHGHGMAYMASACRVRQDDTSLCMLILKVCHS